MWSEGDARWAQDRGVDLDALSDQLRRLAAGDETLRIDRPATVGDGIAWLDASALPTLEIPGHRVTTFVPASGAASRMFAALVAARAEGFRTREALEAAVRGGRKDLAPCLDTYDGRADLAIGRHLAGATLGEALDDWLGERAWQDRPKGLVPLHVYEGGARTAVVEHLLEAAALAGTADTHVHFTVPAGLEDDFLVEREVAGALLGGRAPSVGCSIQHPKTDTVAATPDGAVFRDDEGNPLLRPGGHGALIANLEALGGDLVVVKNIDNVGRDEDRDRVVAWRRGLVARLVELETKVHALLADLDAGREPGPALDFAVRTFGRRGRGETALEMARDALRRPIRVVAVVRNEGQPGGGPFWVCETDGTSTPQIMESAQIDRTDAGQAALFASATHFNPVDMALSLRDPAGAPYPLGPLVDDRGWLRASKTWRGRPLRALERPGLWNGAMAGWNTQFVEVPSWTFRPVKEVRDLLDPGHRSPAAAV